MAILGIHLRILGCKFWDPFLVQAWSSEPPHFWITKIPHRAPPDWVWNGSRHLSQFLTHSSVRKSKLASFFILSTKNSHNIPPITIQIEKSSSSTSALTGRNSFVSRRVSFSFSTWYSVPLCLCLHLNPRLPWFFEPVRCPASEGSPKKKWPADVGLVYIYAGQFILNP